MDTPTSESIDSMDLSDEILRVTKNFAKVESYFDSAKQSIGKMSEAARAAHVSNEGILRSLNTLPHISEGLKIDGLVKPTNQPNPSRSIQR